MGNTCGATAQLRPRRSNLERAMANAVKEKVLGPGSKIKSFNQLLLQFPNLQKGFKKCDDLFDKMDTNSNGVIDVSEMMDHVHELGITEEDKSVLLDSFNTADIDGSKELDRREFILLIAIFHLLKGDEVKLDDDVKRTLDIGTFCFFDSLKQGYLIQKEVMNVLTKSEMGCTELKKTVCKRFHELDWDSDGHISYVEFLFGLEGWVEDVQAE